LRVKDFRNMRRDLPHLTAAGKDDKKRYLPLPPGANALIHNYLQAADHAAALFRSDRNNPAGRLDKRSDAGRRLQAGPAVFSAAGVPHRRPCAAGNGRRQTRSTTGPISPRSRNGLATPTSSPSGSTITGRPGPRTAQLSKIAFDTPPWRRAHDDGDLKFL